MDNCTFCHREMEEGHPRTTLFCQHTLHTFCFYTDLIENYDNDILFYRCPECHVRFTNNVPEEWVPNLDETTATNEALIQVAYETNPEFKQDIKKVIQTSKQTSKHQTALRKVANQKKQELKEPLQAAKNHIKELIQIKQHEFKESEEYKTYTRESSKTNRLITNLRKKYGYNSWDLRKALKDKIGRRNARHLYWAMTPSYLSRRFFRYRLRL